MKLSDVPMLSSHESLSVLYLRLTGRQQYSWARPQLTLARVTITHYIWLRALSENESRKYNHSRSFCFLLYILFSDFSRSFLLLSHIHSFTMRSFALFGLLAAGVSAVALPQDPPERFQGRFRGWHRHHGRPHPSVSVSNSLGNSTQPTPTAGGGSPSQTFASTVSIQTGSSSGLPTVSLSIGNTQPAPTSAGGSPSQIFVTATPTQTESGGALPTGNSTSGSGDASSNISFINSMDTAYGIPKKTWSSQLADNAYKTVKDDHGNVENHELNPGSMAQVISPGRDCK